MRPCMRHTYTHTERYERVWCIINVFISLHNTVDETDRDGELEQRARWIMGESFRECRKKKRTHIHTARVCVCVRGAEVVGGGHLDRLRVEV